MPLATTAVPVKDPGVLTRGRRGLFSATGIVRYPQQLSTLLVTYTAVVHGPGPPLFPLQSASATHSALRPPQLWITLRSVAVSKWINPNLIRAAVDIGAIPSSWAAQQPTAGAAVNSVIHSVNKLQPCSVRGLLPAAGRFKPCPGSTCAELSTAVDKLWVVECW